MSLPHTSGMMCCKFWLVTCDQEDRIHWCSITGGHFFTRHPLVLARRGLCWQKLSDRITQPFSVLLRQDTSRVLTPLPHVLEHWKFAKIQVTCRCLDYVQYKHWHHWKLTVDYSLFPLHHDVMEKQWSIINWGFSNEVLYTGLF